ncbi:MAG TPA: 50S ribosomal protein L24 [Coxiellaceae bacterium]|nr:50S ribosomal protein L24 [Coxiellaceae bacterium]
MSKIKKNDEIIVIKGKDKGRRGKVLRVMTDRVLVEGVNIVKKCVRPNPNKNEQGGILDREASIAVANVALYNPTTKKADRVGFKTLADGKKIRVFKSNGEAVEV